MTDPMTELFARAMEPALFDDNERKASKAASPLSVEVKRGLVRIAASDALSALLTAPLADRLALAERLVPWDPIENVKKQESSLLLYGIDDSGAGPYVDVGHWSDSRDAWILDRLDGCENEIVMRATHARPLPAPPRDEDKSR